MITRRPQRGVILLGLMLLLILATGIFLLQRANGTTATALDREAKTVAALSAAREALLASAVRDPNHPDNPGSLPCPDIKTNISGNNVPGDGKADLFVGNSVCPAYVGWLPWRTLDLNDPRDAAGESLWYALSPNFRVGMAINSNTIGTLSLDGHGDIVALIIAPGGALAGQSRPSANVADYLDDLNGNPATSNRDGSEQYFSGSADSHFNDHLVALDRNTLMNALAPRILGEIRQAARAAGGALPFADSDNDGYPDPDKLSGRFPYRYSDPPPPAAGDPPLPSDTCGGGGSCWHDVLMNNGWFPLITYTVAADRATATITFDFNGKTMNLP
ncbi:hypothetical protein [Azonexus sp.]|jgi:hypothetical protein|uniref:hypothetical protein n=1 Tax=Azonexus sp. TaxID=1872668 RepID=UPI002817143E|nr:hypothetical protein [Azonexus sp.]MDR1996300.1 hypothetical protein [Azonexus sp.]